MAMEIKFMPNGLSLVHQPVEVQIPSTVQIKQFNSFKNVSKCLKILQEILRRG
jgi:hypothetical protein